MYINLRRNSARVTKKAQQTANSLKRDDIKKVAVIRHAAIGDFVVMRPFLIHLKNFFPNARITLSVDRNAMYGMPEDLIDDVHIIDKRDKDDTSKKTSFFSRFRQIKMLAEQDIIFDLTDSTLTILIVLFTKARLKVGYPYRYIRQLFFDIAVPRSDFVLETDSMLHQLNVLGAPPQYPLEYGFKNYERDVEAPYIIYFAGTSMKARCWPEQNFTELIKRLRVDYPGYKHVVLKGIKADEQFNDLYAPLAEYEDVIHQDSMPLDEAMAFLAKSSLVIVGDTGIRNMAISMQAPTLGVMWSPGVSAIRYLPKDVKHAVVFNENFTVPTVDDVYLGASDLLERLYGENK